jgi:phage tail-like protein
MAQFSVNTSRLDPYKSFKFRVLWDGEIVAGVSKVSPLKRTTEVVSHREGGDVSTPRLSPATSKFDPVTLERGITFAPEFEAWANLVYSAEGDGGVSLRNFRKNIRIEMLNLQGTVVRAYNIMRCWPSEFTALPELDANGQGIAFESLVLQNEGHERDLSVVEVAEF